MVQKIITEFTSDLSGDKDASTFRFAVEGINYEVDLTAKEADKFKKAVEPYVSAGRRVRGTTRVQSSGPKVDLAAVRTWAAKNGFEVSNRGRVPSKIIDAYLSAGN